MSQRDLQIADLNAALLKAEALSVEALAAQIRAIGFKCQNCGQCCTGVDNSVVVFPFEIRSILQFSGLEWLEVVRPPGQGEWDQEGCFHTLEWRLVKKGDSCRFYDLGKCCIYSTRPGLCSTYPFYLEEGVLQCSLCSGLGSPIEPAEAMDLARRVIRRYVTELLEAISLLEKYEDFRRGSYKESGDCIVHDSEGAHRIPGGHY